MKKKLGFLLLGMSGVIATLNIQGRPHYTGALDGPNETTITLVQTRTIGQPTVRTWFSDGQFIDAGSWSFLAFHDSGSIFRSPVVGAAQVTLLLVGQNGTITLEQDDLINLQWLVVDPFEVPEAGSWHIVSGTGVYSTLHGAGRYEIDVQSDTNTRTITWELALATNEIRPPVLAAVND